MPQHRDDEQDLSTPELDAELDQLASEAEGDDDGDLFEPDDADDDPEDDDASPGPDSDDSPADDAAGDDEDGQDLDDDGEGSAAGAAPPATSATARGEQEASAPAPFRFRADGVDLEVPGSAVVDIDGTPHVVIPQDAWARAVQPHIRHQAAWQRREQEHRQQLREWDPANNPEVLEAREIKRRLHDLLNDEDKAAEFFENFARNKDILIRDARIAALEAQSTAATQASEAASSEELQAALDVTLDQTVDAFLADPRYQGLDREVTREKLGMLRDRIFFRATRDFPEHGVRRGDPVINYDAIHQLLAPDVKLVEKLAAKGKVDEKATEVERRNARRLDPRRPQHRTTVPARGAPSGSGAKTTEPQSREEWEREFSRTLRDVGRE